MQVLSSYDQLRAYRQALPPGHTLGFVPTMGALHAGHAQLVAEARAQNTAVLVSIFVNPTQFGPTEDLSRYPRTPEADLALLEQLGADAVYTPTPEDLYPPQGQLHISLTHTSRLLEGASRPGHFDGVALVVTKLINQTHPTRLYLGQKDFQQTVVLRQLVHEAFLPVEVVVVPTVREPDGLARSSRNRYLSPAERTAAPQLYRALSSAGQQAQPGLASAAIVQAFAASLALEPAFRLDYAEVVSGFTCQPLAALTPEDRPVLVAAAYLGTTRLLDNLPLLTHTVG